MNDVSTMSIPLVKTPSEHLKMVNEALNEINLRKVDVITQSSEFQYFSQGLPTLPLGVNN